MENEIGIFGIWILDRVSRKILVKRLYLKELFDDHSLNQSISSILSYSPEVLERMKIETVMLDDYKLVYEIVDNFIFIAVVNHDFETSNIKRILSHLHVTFLRKYPIRDCNWQFTENIDHFGEFENSIDDIARHFGVTRSIIKIVLMGLDYAGKTTLTHALAKSDYDNYFPTKGLDILKIDYKNIQIRIWDLGGQKQFRKLWAKFAAEASGVIFVVDSVTDRWTETKEAFDVSRQLDLPFIIFANKQDLTDKAIETEKIAELLNIGQEDIVAGSALLNAGVNEVLDRLIEVIEIS